MWSHRVGVAALTAMLSVGPIALPAPTRNHRLARRRGERDGHGRCIWFTEMQAGRTDRSQYTPAYRPQVTDNAIKEMSHALNGYGASPVRAEIVQTQKIGEQTFYVVKFVFPRGDATSLLFGFDAAAKITAVGIGGMAGD